MSDNDLAKKLADSFSAYLKVDTQKEMDKLEETIEDTLTRLEELENGLDLLQVEREKFASIDFAAARSNLNLLCQRIHKLDEISKRILEDVESLEVEVNNAEVNLVNNTEGKLKNILKPLLFMNSDDKSSQSTPSTSHFTPHHSFKTASFFPKVPDNQL